MYLRIRLGYDQWLMVPTDEIGKIVGALSKCTIYEEEGTWDNKTLKKSNKTLQMEFIQEHELVAVELNGTN